MSYSNDEDMVDNEIIANQHAGEDAYAELGMTTQPVIFNPGDGDSYLVFARIMGATEVRRFNAMPGDFLLFVNYSRTWAVMPVRNIPGHCITHNYVKEKLDGVNIRIQSAFYHIAGWLCDHDIEPYRDMDDLVDPTMMGWENRKSTQKYWRDQLLVMKSAIQNGRWIHSRIRTR